MNRREAMSGAAALVALVTLPAGAASPVPELRQLVVEFVDKLVKASALEKVSLAKHIRRTARSPVDYDLAAAIEDLARVEPRELAVAYAEHMRELTEGAKGQPLPR